MPPCNQCQNDPRCTDRCQAYAELLQACQSSGQMTAEEVAAHLEAGEMEAERCIACGSFELCDFCNPATPLPTHPHQENSK